MSIRLIKKKLINSLLNKKGHKFSSEKLLKFNLKKLNKINKKCCKFIVYLAINYSLPVFQLIKKKLKIKKVKLIKHQPFFILKNKNRIFFSIKHIITFYKNKNLNFKNKMMFLGQNNSYLENKKIEDQEQTIIYKNALKFYRWN
jgi:hypothetical protein